MIIHNPNINIVRGQGAADVEDKLVCDFISEHFTTDQGKPFLFKGREYWWPIYENRWPMLIIMSSRQAEKSSYVAKRSFFELINTPNEEILYATASGYHLKIFARSKIDKLFEHRPELKNEYFNKSSINNIHEKRFLNGSVLLLRAIGIDAESGRAATARKIYFDEVQSIDSDNIPIVTEITQSYENSEYAFLGTPLTPQNTLSLRYKNSWQYEWIIHCDSCNRDNPPLGKEHIDSDKPYLFCVHCGKPMLSSRGRWVKQNPGGKYPGFRICRLMTPTCTWRTDAQDGVLDKYDGPDAYPEFRFVNEVLGLPEGIGIQPITEEALYANCASGPDDYEWIDPASGVIPWLQGLDIVGTIDWAWSTAEGGQSFTIYAIWMLQNGRIKCLYAKRQIGPKYTDPDYSLSEMIRAFIACGVKIVATDFGVGHKENMRLRSRLEGVSNIQVFEVMYAGDIEHPRWNNVDKRYHVGKTESLDYTFSELNRGGYMFPRVELAQQYISDILNVYIEVDPNRKRKKYEHSGTGPDDFLHLANYARMMFKKLSR